MRHEPRRRGGGIIADLHAARGVDVARRQAFAEDADLAGARMAAQGGGENMQGSGEECPRTPSAYPSE